MDNNPLRVNPLNKYMKVNPLNKYMSTPDEETLQDKISGIGANILGGGAILGGGLLATKALTKGLPKQVGSLFRGMADIPTADIKRGKEIGFKNIFTQDYENPAYLGKTLAPQVSDELGSEIARLKQDYTTTLNQIPETGLVKMTNSKQMLEGLLQKLQLIDSSGTPIQRNLKSASTSNPAYRQLYSEYKRINESPEGLPRIVVQDVRNNLNKLFKDLPQDIIAQDAKLALYQDLEDAGAKGMRAKAAEYSQVYPMEEYYNTENLPASKLKLKTLFRRGMNPENASLTQEAVGRILPESSTQRIMGDIEKYKIAQDFSPRGSFAPSRSQIIKKLSRPIMKGYYESVQPRIAGLQQRVGSSGIGKGFMKAGKVLKNIPGIGGLFSMYPAISQAMQYGTAQPGTYGVDENGNLVPLSEYMT